MKLVLKQDSDGIDQAVEVFKLVTAGSEEPVLRSARGAAIGRAPLQILVTTTGWIMGHLHGILGPIWRTPESTHRCCWLPRPAIAEARHVPRLVWPTGLMAGEIGVLGVRSPHARLRSVRPEATHRLASLPRLCLPVLSLLPGQTPAQMPNSSFGSVDFQAETIVADLSTYWR